MNNNNNDDIIAQLKMILQSQNNTQQLDNPPLPKKCSFEDALNTMQPNSHSANLGDSLAYGDSTTYDFAESSCIADEDITNK